MPSTTTWVPMAEGSPFPIHGLPYGVFSRADDDPRIGVAIGDFVLDLAPLTSGDELPDLAGVFAQPSLNAFMALGPRAWNAARHWITERLGDEAFRDLVEPKLIPREEVALHLPFEVGDFVDFYASEHHATNLGTMLRPGDPPLLPNWKHLPVGYHGRAGTVVASGTPVVRPHGQRPPDETGAPSFGPATRLDFEAEVGFVVGVPTKLGQRVGVDDVAEHVFGVVLVNDWSARDLQAWEYRPLGPFLAKSFATSISPWVLPMAALDAARISPPAQDPAPLPYLRGTADFALDLDLEVRLNGQVISRPAYRDIYWTPGQLLAHLTVNGAALRIGDLFASGTVSGPEPGQRGSLMELSWNGADPIQLTDGTVRTFLEDGDVVTISASAPCPGPAGARLHLGEVSGQILAAT